MKHDSHKSRFQVSLGLLCLKLEQNDASKNFLALRADFLKSAKIVVLENQAGVENVG